MARKITQALNRAEQSPLGDAIGAASLLVMLVASLSLPALFGGI
ncbi:hypothetical protein [Limimaricola sp.]|nr:hypothetical protein [Limimaricola sp.]